jgi:hypothetical protein
MQTVMAIYFDGKNIKNRCEHIQLGTAEKRMTSETLWTACHTISKEEVRTRPT